jgi:hypothetical protein
VYTSGNRGETGMHRSKKLTVVNPVAKPEPRPLALADRAAQPALGDDGSDGGGSYSDSYTKSSDYDSSSSSDRKKSKGKRVRDDKKSKKDRKRREKKSRRSKKEKKEKKHRKHRREERKSTSAGDKRRAPDPAESALQKKCREALEKAEAKEKEKMMSAQLKAANVIKAKVDPVIKAIKDLTEQGEYEFVPGVMTQQLQATLAGLLQAQGHADACIENHGDGTIDDLKDITTLLTSAKKHMTLVQTMMKTVKKNLRS